MALTDGLGQVRTQYNYSPFGETEIMGEPSDNPFQYTGRENDRTGLYYYRARYYSPELKRFVSEDPILRPQLFITFGTGKSRKVTWVLPGLISRFIEMLSINSMLYVEDNSINFIDPYGMSKHGNRYQKGDLCMTQIISRINNGGCPGEYDCFICCGELCPLGTYAVLACEDVCIAGLKAHLKRKGRKCPDLQ